MICIMGGCKLNGGSEEDRTLYLLNANQALSQMSYRPTTNILIRYANAYRVFIIHRAPDFNKQKFYFYLSLCALYFLIGKYLNTCFWYSGYSGYFLTEIPSAILELPTKIKIKSMTPAIVQLNTPK